MTAYFLYNESDKWRMTADMDFDYFATYKRHKTASIHLL